MSLKLFKILDPFLIIMIFAGFGTPISGQNYFVESYGIIDGLVNPSVHAIYQDKFGFMWFGTENGISRFDGQNFVNTNTPDTVFNKWVYKFDEDSTGNKYLSAWDISTRKISFWKMTDSNIFQITSSNFNNPSALSISDKNKLLLSSYGEGLKIYNNSGERSSSENDGLISETIINICNADSGKFIITDKAVQFYRVGKISHIFNTDNLVIDYLYQDKNGNYWCSAVKDGLYFFNGTSFQKIYADNNFFADMVIEDGFGNIWAATNKGIIIVNQQTLKIQPQPEFIENRIIISLNKSRDGIIWLGTQGEGVIKLTPNYFSNYTVADGLPSNTVFPIIEDKNLDIWIGTSSGIAKWEKNQNQFSSFNLASSSMILNLALDNNGNLLFGDGSIPFLYKNKKLNTFPKTGINTRLRRIFEDDSGNIWIDYTNEGFYKLNKNKWEKIPLPQHARYLNTTAHFKDSQGRIWFGTLKLGTFIFENNILEKFETDQNIFNEPIQSISEDSEGNIWFAFMRGLARLSSTGIIKIYTQSDGLSTSICYAVYCSKDYIYIGTGTGLNIFDGEYFTTLIPADGLIYADINANSIIEDNKGNIWIGSDKGISVFNPKLFFENRISSKTVITNFKYDDFSNELPNVNQKFALPAGINSFNVSFTGINYHASKLNYRYMLGNLDTGWNYDAAIQKVEYNDLSPGEYVFAVSSKKLGENWSKPAKIIIIIEGMFYQKVWFYLISFSLMLIVGFISLKYKNGKALRAAGNKYKTSSLSAEAYNNILNIIVENIETRKRFKESDISVKKLSEEFNLHKEHISQVINSHFQMNFNEYVNNLRIEEAKIMLNDEMYKAYKILAIALEVGFNSKNTFNAAFKKHVNKTPSEFRKNFINSN